MHGTLRSSRKILWERDSIRVNAVCPGVTESEMTKHIIGTFKEQNLFWQSPKAVGNIIVGIEADSSIVGKAYYIEGGDGWEIEDTFYNSQPQWLSEEGCRRMRVNSEAVQKVRKYKQMRDTHDGTDDFTGRPCPQRMMIATEGCHASQFLIPMSSGTFTVARPSVALAQARARQHRPWNGGDHHSFSSRTVIGNSTENVFAKYQCS